MKRGLRAELCKKLDLLLHSMSQADFFSSQMEFVHNEILNSMILLGRTNMRTLKSFNTTWSKGAIYALPMENLSLGYFGQHPSNQYLFTSKYSRHMMVDFHGSSVSFTCVWVLKEVTNQLWLILWSKFYN